MSKVITAEMLELSTRREVAAMYLEAKDDQSRVNCLARVKQVIGRSSTKPSKAQYWDKLRLAIEKGDKKLVELYAEADKNEVARMKKEIAEQRGTSASKGEKHVSTLSALAASIKPPVKLNDANVADAVAPVQAFVKEPVGKPEPVQAVSDVDARFARLEDMIGGLAAKVEEVIG